MPTVVGYGREVAAHFQALAFIRYPINSFLFLTPDESWASLHLYSMIGSPFIEAGFLQAGRVISLASSVVTIIMISKIGKQLFNPNIGHISASIMLVHPLFINFVPRFQPEALSIALTTTAVWTTCKYNATKSASWYISTIFIILFAIMNHLWEAVVIIPIVVLLIYEKNVLEGITAGIITACALILARVIVNFQPWRHSRTTSGFESSGDVLFSPEWLFHLNALDSLPVHPINIAVAVTLPLSIIVLLITIADYKRKRTKQHLILASWLGSGLLIPVSLAEGYMIASHQYYLWGVLAPLSLSIGLLSYKSFRYFSRNSKEFENILRVYVVTLVGISLIYILIVEVAILSGSGLPVVSEAPSAAKAPIEGIDHGEAVSAGRKISNIGVDDPSNIVFAGAEYAKIPESNRYWSFKAETRILMYSDVLVTEREIGYPPDGNGPVFATNISNIDRSNCKAIIHRKNRTFRVIKC